MVRHGRSERSRRRLAGINFLVAAVQTGFGPFLAIFLTRENWSQADIGFALGIGSVIALVSQLPAGALVDQFHRKSRAAAGATAAIGLSALAIGLRPTWATVLAASVVHSFASAMLGPSIAALTLAVRGPADLGEDYGHNARYAALGSAAAAITLGLSGSYLSQRSVLLVTAGLTVPAVLITLRFRAADRAAAERQAHAAMLHPRERRRCALRTWHMLIDRGLLIFAGCAALFFLGNAAVIVLAGNRLGQHSGTGANLLLSAGIIVPQIVVASLSPWLGRVAKARGRRPVLLLGFLAQPIRGLLLAATISPYAFIAGQALDGISGAVFAVMVPLIAADLSYRTGWLNLTMGAIDLAIGLGAALSTSLGGITADRFGYPAAFLGLSAVAGSAALLTWAAMPETRPAETCSPARLDFDQGRPPERSGKVWLHTGGEP